MDITKYKQLQEEFEEYKTTSMELEEQLELALEEAKEETKRVEREKDVLVGKRRKELKDFNYKIECLEGEGVQKDEEKKELKEKLRAADVELDGSAQQVRRCNTEKQRQSEKIEILEEEIVLLNSEKEVLTESKQTLSREVLHLKKALHDADNTTSKPHPHPPLATVKTLIAALEEADTLYTMWDDSGL